MENSAVTADRGRDRRGCRYGGYANEKKKKCEVDSSWMLKKVIEKRDVY